MFCMFLLTAFFSFIFGLYLRPAFISVQGRPVYLISITNSGLFKYLLQKMTRLLKIIQNWDIVTNLTLFTHTLFLRVDLRLDMAGTNSTYSSIFVITWKSWQFALHIIICRNTKEDDAD